MEILSLSLKPKGRVAQDSSVVRLFVEYSLLDLPTEETPLSLPKPPLGKSINYNYSKGESLHETGLQHCSDTLHGSKFGKFVKNRLICFLFCRCPSL